MFRAEARNIILSSMAHQLLINRSSIAHLGSSWLIFSFGSSSFGSSTLFPSLLGLSSVRCVVTPRTVRVCMYSVRYILRQAPSCPTSRRPLLLHSTHRLTAAKLGTSRLRGGNGFSNRLGRVRAGEAVRRSETFIVSDRTLPPGHDSGAGCGEAPDVRSDDSDYDAHGGFQPWYRSYDTRELNRDADGHRRQAAVTRSGANTCEPRRTKRSRRRAHRGRRGRPSDNRCDGRDPSVAT